MSALDSSVVIAALTQWHEAHDAAREQAWGQRVPVHAYLESYAVLTRLPPPRRLDVRTAHELLSVWFPRSQILQPGRRGATGFVRRMAAADVSGGAVYDALVALTAAEHGEELLTRDRRAESTYRRLGVRYRLVA
ncbi:MAG: PIN domain-containing protein [Acidimicrobiales bacterium]